MSPEDQLEKEITKGVLAYEKSVIECPASAMLGWIDPFSRTFTETGDITIPMLCRIVEANLEMETCATCHEAWDRWPPGEIAMDIINSMAKSIDSLEKINPGAVALFAGISGEMTHGFLAFTIAHAACVGRPDDIDALVGKDNDDDCARFEALALLCDMNEGHYFNAVAQNAIAYLKDECGVVNTAS